MIKNLVLCNISGLVSEAIETRLVLHYCSTHSNTENILLWYVPVQLSSRSNHGTPGTGNYNMYKYTHSHTVTFLDSRITGFSAVHLEFCAQAGLKCYSDPTIWFMTGDFW